MNEGPPHKGTDAMNDPSHKPLVAVAKADGHYEGSRKALELIEDRIAESIEGKNRVLIKPNFVSTRNQPRRAMWTPSGPS